MDYTGLKDLVRKLEALGGVDLTPFLIAAFWKPQVLFIDPDVREYLEEYVGEGGQTVLKRNHPVNIILCTSIEKRDRTDGWGKTYYEITFRGISVTWNYGQNAKSVRDNQYNKILKAYSR